MTLTKDRLIEKVREKTNCSAQDAKKSVEMILELMKSRLENGEEVKISGFGKWIVKKKRSRPGRNPHTGARIEIAARKVVTFHPSDKMRNIIDAADLPDSLISTSTGEEDDE